MRARGFSVTLAAAITAVNILLPSPSLHAQNVTWTQRTTTPQPPNRCCFAMVDDSKRQRTVLFGGWTGSAVLGDTWEWDGTNWTQMNPTQSPPGRCCHVMAFDVARGRVVLFGGANGTGATVDLADTWEYDGSTWTQMNPTNSPSARRSPMMTGHLGKVLLFGGGQTNSGNVKLNDTWEWDGQNWTQKNPSTKPSARWGGVLVFQLLRARSTLFGGYAQGLLQDTWDWDGQNWTAHSPKNSPSARWSAGAAYELHRQRVVLFGGRGNLGDTWTWDGKDWTQLTPPSFPSGRSDLGMSYSLSRNTVTLFGGFQSGVIGETWELTPSTASSYTNIGSGCSGSAGTPILGALGGGPIIGRRFDVQVSRIPTSTNAILLLFGASKTQWGSTALPWNMSAVGMNGCSLFVSADVLLPLGAANGAAGFGYVVPNDRNLLQVTYYNQAYVPDLQLGPFGATMSNAMEAIVGDR